MQPKVLRLRYMSQQEPRRCLPRAPFPARPHLILPIARRKSLHQNPRNLLLQRRNPIRPAPASLRSLQRSVTDADDFDFDEDDDYDYLQPSKVKSTEKRALSKKKKGGCLKPFLIFLLILVLAGGGAFAYGTYIGYDFSFINDLKEKILNHTDGTDENDKKEDTSNKSDSGTTSNTTAPETDKDGTTTNSDLSGGTDSTNGTDNTTGTDSTDGSDSNSTDNSGTTEPDASTDNSGTTAQ